MKLTPERQDINPSGRAPKEVRRLLLQLGGTNPYGEPNIRIAQADSILIYRGNEWRDYPPGTKLEDHSGLEFCEQKQIVNVAGRTVEMPIGLRLKKDPVVRVVKEMRWIKRYPDLKGWMLQHWDPPNLYGSRRWWEAQVVPGTDLQYLGPFPEKGDYEPFIVWVDFDQKTQSLSISNLTSPEIMPFSKMEEAYGQWMQRREEVQSGNPDWRMLNRMIEAQRQQEAKEKKEQEDFDLRMKDATNFIYSSSLEAGRHREEMAKRARARGVELGHVGN